ncbi:MAG: DNA polymerase III subunit gamma/tau [Candidatus Cryptobacteroides sp.]|nr:DNA polymerase III subunit gamma/tau [Bacteroidales bacterium]MDY5459439.1 DNA polymerase III subunit gamma/tau [Candidatus Cryptobacteroides sp.]
MSDYVVSARKYRPDSFETLIGQDNIARTLKNSIQRGQLAHAYLFCGPRGVGKTSSARIFAKAINCSNPSADMEPCGECESCRSFAEGRSYCIHELDAASNNGVEDIKALMEQVQIPPQVGKYSVYIIDEVHMLSQQAFNAFLKTLEEPPSYAIFILCTTEKHKIIPTILSRCQTYDFNRISVPDIMRNLRSIAEKENVKIGDDSLHVIARKADGAMRDALTIFDQTIAFCGTDVKYSDVLKNLNVLDYDYSFKLVDAALAGDYATVLLIIDEVLAKGFNSLYFVVSVGEHLRDLLVSRTGGLESLLDFPENLKERYRKQAESCSVDFLYNALNCISACEAGFKSAANQRLFIEFGLMKLCFINHKPSAQAAAPAPQPAQELQPQPAPAPQPSAKAPEGLAEKASELQPKPAGRQRRSSASLSLNSLATESKAASAGTDVETMPEGEIPGEQEMERVWKNIITMCQSNPVSSRLAGIFSSAPYEVGESDGLRTLTIKVESESTKKWLEDKFVLRMENKMKEGLASQKVRFIVEVLPQEEFKPIIYMPADKAKKLMVDNPEVGNLVTDLELDS